MPVKKGTPLDPDRTRQHVLESATRTFYRFGVGVGVNDLAREAAVSKATVYRFFDSKDGLLDAVLERRSNAVFDWLDAAVAEHEDPVDRILAVFDALRSWHREQTFRGCALVNAATQAREGPAPARAARHLGRYRDLLAGLAGEAGVEDPEAAARRLLLLIEGATTIAAIDGGVHAAEDARNLARMVLSAAVDAARG